MNEDKIEGGAEVPAADEIEDNPQPDPLAKEWSRRISAAKRHWEPFFKRCRHNRKVVQNYDTEQEPDSPEYVKHRANLILGMINTLLPTIYSRNPDIEVTPRQEGFKSTLFCKTLETVLNRQLEDANLKLWGAEVVRASLICSYGVIKVLYQKDIHRDPEIQNRLDDTQDNIRRLESLVVQIEDDQSKSATEAKLAELRETMAGLEAQAEVVASEGLVIDRVMTDALLIDPSVQNFDDYRSANWMAQAIFMERDEVEGRYKKRIQQATTFNATGDALKEEASISEDNKLKGSDLICVWEIWDKRSQMVYTLADGCNYWLRDPFPPPVQGRRFYPFFLLPFNKVDGCFVAPSLVDLAEKLQNEHNALRNKLDDHRKFIQPGYIAGNDIKSKDIESFQSASVGNVTILKGLDSSEVQKAFIPKQYPPIDGALYDTSAIRMDIEQCVGLQDAARSSINKAKTATEAQIMDNSLSARISMFQDWTEEFLSEMCQYAGQLLLLELSEPAVERIMGPAQPLLNADGQPTIDSAGMPVMQKTYDWPELSRDDIFEQIAVKIRAGSTGKPNRLQEQENWGRILPTLIQLYQLVVQAVLQGSDYKPIENMLAETLNRFDDRLDVKDFMPNVQEMQAQLAQQQAQAAQPIQ